MANEKKVKKSHRSRRTVAVFWISLILVLLPIVILGWILFSTAMDTGSPIFGNRYEGDLNPAITSENLDAIDTNVAAIEGVESEFHNLASATLRVYVKIPNESTEETAHAVADQAYTVISETLDPSVYFTQADGKKMYDLEIHVYNLGEDADRTSEEFVYVIETKTSSMGGPEKQTVSNARFPELAERLRQDVIDRKAAEEAAAAEAAAAAAEASANPESTADTEESAPEETSQAE